MPSQASFNLSAREAFDCLERWCRDRDFAGYDPFDGLNSHLFQTTPFKASRSARLAWLQAFKRSPVNLRVITRVKTSQNAKGMALFALGYTARFRFEKDERDKSQALRLLDYLIEQRIETNSGVAWGYNFDWQNRAFLAPRGTPTIVPTAFAVRALTEAATAFGEQGYLELATRACSFITSALNVTDESDDEICWSYSPLDRTRVLNASLLAAESLATVGKLTSNAAFLDLALRGARYVARRQQPDGSWAYGAEGFQGWVDNFHTAFVLTSLHRIATACDADAELRPAIERGYEFWSTRFFRSDGWPKYYPDSDYPADAHSSGAALVALAELRSVDPGSNELARRIANWTIVNLQDKDGYFYYQRKRFYVNRVAYMRWSQAWMFYGLARFLEVERSESGTEAGSRKDIGHPEDRV